MLSIAVLIVIFVAIIIDATFWRKASREVHFTVNPGQGTREIGDALAKQKLISSSLIFDLTVHANHWLIQTGVYKVTPKMNLWQIASMFHSGEVEENIVTIPEGWRVTQIDDLLTQKHIIKKGDFTTLAKNQEGYLFPDTYHIPLNTSAQKIIEIMSANFKHKTTGLKISASTIILASIIEREAKFDADRPIIASVYLNRIFQSMRLQADPTIQYAKGSWAPITRNDYQNFASPYNTYLVDGYPPTPICNPGLKSIEAAANPAQTDYLFFFSDKQGHAIFSKNLAEHDANLAKYQ